MKAKMVAALLTAFVVSLGIIGLSGAVDVPDTITMNSALWPKHTKSLVTWSHKKHTTDYGVACTECHHHYEGGKNVWKEGDPVQKCDECHNEPSTKAKEIKALPKEKQKLNLYKAIHDNCVGCHKKLKKKDRKKYAKIPTSCTKCHPRKK